MWYICHYTGNWTINCSVFFTHVSLRMCILWYIDISQSFTNCLEPVDSVTCADESFIMSFDSKCEWVHWAHTQHINAPVVRRHSQRAASVSHGWCETPAVRLHVVSLHRVQLIRPIVSAHHVDVVPQRAHTWTQITWLTAHVPHHMDESKNRCFCSLQLHLGRAV